MIKELGKLQTEIYFCHDAEQFKELAAAASLIFDYLGINKRDALRVGNLISEAYQLSDKAETARRNGDTTGEGIYYLDVQQRLRKAERILGYKKGIADHQLKWWVNFRHKRMLMAVYHIFAQHLIPYGILNLPKVMLASYYLVQVGLGHNKRDKGLSIHFSEKYWRILLNAKGTNLPYIG